MRENLIRISNFLVSLLAGIASFIFTLVSLLVLHELDEQIAASFTMGMFALLIVWVAYERPNSGHARAVAALIDRLMAVEAGDLKSPAPPAVRRELPDLASAVDNLFEQVQATLDNVNAMALYDPITALPNRVHFKREADRMLKSAREGETIALLFIDLDGFKEVNDRFGHAYGDEVLRIVADRLRDTVKTQSVAKQIGQPLVARLAGDEFTLLFRFSGPLRRPEKIAEQVLEALNKRYENKGRHITMGASIGVAIYPRHGMELPSLMRAADIAMYQAKESGRSRVCVYQSQLSAIFDQKAEAEAEIRDGLSRGEFQLSFQPWISVRTGELTSCDGIVSWHHPTKGVLQPESFIHSVEVSSLIPEYGDWLIAQSISALREWKEGGFSPRLWIEVSSSQFQRSGFMKRLCKGLAEADLSLAQIGLMLPERIVMECSGVFSDELGMLKRDGALMGVDGFGAGGANLARINDLPLDFVRLHPSLTDDIDVSDSTKTVVTAVVHLIHGFGLKSAVSGVARPDQMEVLRAMGCDEAQGPAIASSLSGGDFLAWGLARKDEMELRKIA